MAKMKTFSLGGKYFLVIALTVSCCMILGCEYFPESTFALASESRLPKWITLPPGLTRASASVTMSYYIAPWGSSAKFTLEDRNGKVLEEVSGNVKGSEPLHLKNHQKGVDASDPAYEIVTANGITEIIEHRKPEPIFYVNDDPSVRRELMESNP